MVRQKIIDAGKRVIFRDGIWKATTRKIAQDAGINVATIHYHFANKDALIVAVLEQMIGAIRAAAEKDFAGPSRLAVRIERVIRLSWEYSERDLSGQLMQSEIPIYALRNHLPDLAMRQLSECLDVYATVFRAADDVVSRKDLDIAGLSRFVVAGIDGILLQHYVESDNRQALEACEKLAWCAQRYPLTVGRRPLTALTLGTRRSAASRKARRWHYSMRPRHPNGRSA